MFIKFARGMDCGTRRKCFGCNAGGHHTAICEKEMRSKGREKKEEKEPEVKPPAVENTVMVNAQTSVLLQTVRALMFDSSEERSIPVKILLDPGS